MEKGEIGQEYQNGGCGGFSKGIFSERFRSIEEHEKSLEAKQSVAASQDRIWSSSNLSSTLCCGAKENNVLCNMR